MVGDENQSIYRFRNADLEVFRAERRAAEASPDRDVLPLLGNFRSRPAVLAAVNEVGRTLLDGFARADRRARRRRRASARRELLLTLDEGRARDARKWAQEEIDLEPPPGRLAGEGDRRGALPRPAPARARRRAARPSAARSSSCCGRSPTSTPTRRR